jgi:Ca2+-binding EF-hand superfamily protein
LEPDEIESGGWPPQPSEYDGNGDGILTAREMAAQFAFNRSLRREMGIEAVDNVGANYLLKQFDKDNDKKLAADEHAKAPLPKLAKDFDENEDGKLGVVELATMLAKHRRDAGLSKPDTVKIRNIFRQFDLDADGRIELKGLAGLSVVGGVSVEKQLGETYDGNQDGVVTIAEVEKVVAAARKERGYAEEEFQKAKQMITRHDRNNSKHIEESELFEKPETGYLPKSMFKNADLNDDGKVGLDELARYFAKQKS